MPCSDPRRGGPWRALSISATVLVVLMATIWHVTMSIDGFIAGPGDAMEWMAGYEGTNPEVDELVASIGAILAGRGSYDAGAKQSNPAFQKPYGGAWSGPIFVLTHRPTKSRDPDVIFFSADISRAVATAQKAARDKNVAIFGADVARQAVEKGLIDELFVHIAPVLLGDGTRLYAHPAATRVKLQPISVSQPSDVTNLRFRFLK